jgi:hypothetical protein
MTVTLELPELDERSKKGLAIYDEQLKPLLEPVQNGKGIAIHPESGDHEVGKTPFLAARALRQRHPGEQVAMFKIGLEPDHAMTARYLPLNKHRCSEPPH